MHLKTSHPYYSQVQTQMFVTERMYCDFVVWTKRDCVILPIFQDRAFWEPRLQKAQEFFTKVCLPELVAKHFLNIFCIKLCTTPCESRYLNLSTHHSHTFPDVKPSIC